MHCHTKAHESHMSAALFNHAPMLKSLPHVDLATLPTPLEHEQRLGELVGVPNLWVKRDDQTGTLYGGNKVRKLAFLLGDAKDKGARDVLTLGAIGSNHVLATALYAREHGLGIAAQQFPQPITDHVLQNLRALSTTRPELELVGHPIALPFTMFKRQLMAWLNRRDATYYIPGGGSNAVGTLGYVDAALELRAQIDQGLAPEPDAIFVTAGTCGTIAGLALGLKMAGLSSHIYAVRVVDRVVTNIMQVLKLVKQTRDVLMRHGLTNLPDVSRSDVTFLHDYIGKDYGYPTAQAMRAIETAQEGAGLHLEPTYTGKTFGALMAERVGLELEGKQVLYWHTLNGVDLTPRIEQADVIRDLPKAYHEFFPSPENQDTSS